MPLLLLSSAFPSISLVRRLSGVEVGCAFSIRNHSEDKLEIYWLTKANRSVGMPLDICSKELLYGSDARSFVSLHELCSDSDTFGDSGASAKNISC